MFSLKRVLHFILILIIIVFLFLHLLIIFMIPTIIIMVKIFTIRIIFARISIKEGSSWKCIAPISWAPLSSNEPSSNSSSVQCRTSSTKYLQLNLLPSFLFKWTLHITNVQNLAWNAQHIFSTSEWQEQKCRLCWHQIVPGFCTSTVVPGPPLRSMEDGTINSDERGTTSKVSTECPLTKSTHSVSTIDKVHFRESVHWTISPLHALSKGRSLKRADPLLCSKYGTEDRPSAVWWPLTPAVRSFWESFSGKREPPTYTIED